MMKHFSLLLIGALLLSMVVGAQAFEKTILVEYFTNVNCGPCAGQHDPIENMLANYTREEIAYITYHTSWPSSSDGYYVGNIPENTGRWNYYGVNYVPWFQCEGLWGDYSQLNSVLPLVTPRIGTYTPFQIEFDAWPDAGVDVPITATLTCAEATQGDMRFNIVLIDKSMVVPVGSNGVDDYSYNMIDMAYNYTGQSFTSAGGNEQIVFDYTFSIPNNNTFGNLGAVAFVQNYTTGEIFQARYISSPEVVITGTITHEVTGLPLWMAVVELNGGEAQDLTTQDGQYGFSGLVEGNHYFDVFMAGYEQLTTTPQFFAYGGHVLDMTLINSHDVINMVGAVTGTDNAMGAFQVGNTAYTAMGWNGLTIANVADLANPTVLGTLDLAADAEDVVVDGNYAYVSCANGVHVVDVSNPAAPVEVGLVTTTSSCYNIDKSGNYVYASAASLGLVIVDVSTPTSPSLVIEFDTPGFARDVVISGNHALVADGASGISIVDVSTPAAPVVTGTLDTPGYASGIEVSGTTAFIADDSQGVAVINVSNPASPTLITQIVTTGRAKQLALNSNWLFVAEYQDGFYVYDVTNPNNATQAGYSLTPGITNNVCVFGDNAYVADNGLMLLFDVSTLGNNAPALLTLTPTSSTVLPAAGGTITYDTRIQTFMGQSYNGVDYWETALLPTGTHYGPWAQPMTFNVTPFYDVTLGRSVAVPGNAPAGEYVFIGHAGYYPQMDYMQGTFTFTKTGQVAGGDEGWSSDGDTFGVAGDGEAIAIPLEYALETAYPNPFNPSTTVYVGLPEAADLTVSVYNVLGQQVAVLASDRMNAGRHALTFDAHNMASGLYFVRATVPGHLNQVQKVMLVR
jgi:hypothetical protein